MFQLVHAARDCAGRWLRVEQGEAEVRWRCSRCGAEYADGTAVRFAVLRDYDLELVVSRLAREGRRLLRRPRREAEGPASQEDGT